jgi:hypothetical protein
VSAIKVGDLRIMKPGGFEPGFVIEAGDYGEDALYLTSADTVKLYKALHIILTARGLLPKSKRVRP